MDMGATFYNGGPQTLAWGIILVVVGAMAQALSMAELATIQPIAGAQYHWTHFLAPEKHRRFITVRTRASANNTALPERGSMSMAFIAMSPVPVDCTCGPEQDFTLC